MAVEPRIYVVRVDPVGASVAPRSGDPLFDSALVELARFLGRAAEAAGRAVGDGRPIVRLSWHGGLIDVVPQGEGEYLALVLIYPPEPPRAVGAGEGAVAGAGF